MKDPQELIAEATRLPIRFAIVREDPEIDLAVVDRVAESHRKPPDVAVIGSGGCTVATLAARSRARSLTIVDPNPAQLALVRLKLLLLESEPPEVRRCILGYQSCADREQRLADRLESLGLSPDALGPLPVVADRGPDDSGRYELLFAALRARLRSSEVSLELLWNSTTVGEQVSTVAPSEPLGRALDDAFREIFSLETLVRLFGTEATQNPRVPFWKHFVDVLRAELGRRLARSNPFVVSLLAGMSSVLDASPSWLSAPVSNLPERSFSEASMQSFLDSEDHAFDVIQLSNITDWLDESSAIQLLERARSCLRPGGAVILRQLNSSLDLDRVLDRFSPWSGEPERQERDRSFFYRRVIVGSPR